MTENTAGLFTFRWLYFCIFPGETLSSSILVLEISMGSCIEKGCSAASGHLQTGSCREHPFPEPPQAGSGELLQFLKRRRRRTRSAHQVINTAIALSAELGSTRAASTPGFLIFHWENSCLEEFICCCNVNIFKRRT